MIIRKPYAFLIKNFRLIHGLLFVLLTFIFIKSIEISTFFSSYATQHYFTNTATLVSDHVNFLVLIAPIFIIILSSIIYYLLSIKNKNRKAYLFIVIFYLILFIYFIYMMNVFSNLQNNALNVETVRALRDISIIVLIPQILFIFLMISRTLGFNLKQFEFKKDLEELQIDTTDYEEVEITLGKNNYKYLRTFKKMLRETKYYIEENKFFVTIILSIFVLSISIAVYVNIRVTNIKYEVNQSIYANTMWYTVKEVYVSTKDTSGKIIDNDSQYIIVQVEIDNKSNMRYDLSRELFRLKINKNDILPKFNLNKEFIDLGKTYYPMTIDAGEVKIVNVIFEIDNKEEQKEYLFRINNLENLYAADTQYKDIIVIPKNIDKVTDIEEYSLQDNIELDNELFGNTSFIINDYEIKDSYKDNYVYCYKKNCYDKTYTIKPSDIKKKVLKLDYSLNIDQDSFVSNIIKESSDIFEYFGNLKYKYLTKEYEDKLDIIKTEHTKNGAIYFEVPSNITEADTINIIFNIRNKNRSITLK